MRIFSRSKEKIFLLVTLFILSSVSISFAQTEDPTLSGTPPPSEYQLAYPGLLPDHPLYFLRQLRDDVFGFFISNSVKKAEYNLLQSDKRVEASAMLLKKNNIALAEKTLIQAISYFEEAITKATEAQKQGMGSIDLVKRLSFANRKHQEVVTNLEKKSPKRFSDERKKIVALDKKVKALQSKK